MGDRVRDQLREMADDPGGTLSEFVRDLLMAASVPVYERQVVHGRQQRLRLPRGWPWNQLIDTGWAALQPG